MYYIDTQGEDEVAIQVNPCYCLRCGNQEASLFGRYFSSTLQKDIYYCRACLIFGRVSEHTKIGFRKLCLPKSFQWTFPTARPNLTDIQQTCVNQIRRALDMGEKTLDVIAVTGAGKTEMMLEITHDFLRQEKCTAFVCPRIDVIRELYDRVERYFPKHLIIGWHYGNHEKRLGHIYIMTMHQLIHYKQFFDLIIIDEADAYPFVEEKENNMLQGFIQRGLKQSGICIYMTATPRIQHGKPIYLMTKFNKRKLPSPKFVHVSHLMKRLRYGLKVKRFPNLCEGKWLIFVPSIEIGEHVLMYMQAVMKLKKSTFVHSQDILRSEKIEQFRNDEISLLITTSILERGVTFDYVSVLILFPEHRLMSEEMIIQVCGRVDRGEIEKPYRLEAYYEVYTDKIGRVLKRIKEMNSLREKAM